VYLELTDETIFPELFLAGGKRDTIKYSHGTLLNTNDSYKGSPYSPS